MNTSNYDFQTKDSSYNNNTSFSNKRFGELANYVNRLKKDVINVKNFGAKGDGVTDDTVAIQLSVTAASSGQTIFFPKGKYVLTDPIVISSDVSMQGDSCDSVEIDCQYTGIQFRNSKTLNGVSFIGITFTGNSNNICFSAGDRGYGFHRVVFDRCSFNTFSTAIEARYTIFMSFFNTYFNQNGIGVAFKHDRAPAGSTQKTYHNVNSFKNCYFRQNDTGVVFRPEAIGGGLLVDTTAFDVNDIAIDASSPVEIINGYFERNGIAVNMDNENRAFDYSSLSLSRCYLLGSPTSVSQGGTAYTGFKLDNVRCDVSSSITFADYFQNSFYITNNSIFVNSGTSEIVTKLVFYADSSCKYYELTKDVNEPYKVYEIEDVSTTPQAVVNAAFSLDSYVVRILTPNSTKLTFFISIGTAGGVFRCNAFGYNSGDVTRIDYKSFSISAYPDQDSYGSTNTYTFSIDSNGIFYISANHEILGTTKLFIIPFCKKPEGF